MPRPVERPQLPFICSCGKTRADECRKRGLSARLTQQWFETFVSPTRFSAIIIPAGSFQLITSTASATAVLRRFHDHLAPGGRLILDLDPISGFRKSPESVRSWTTDSGDLLILTARRVDTDYIAQTSGGLRRVSTGSPAKSGRPDYQFRSPASGLDRRPRRRHGAGDAGDEC